jgi:hypothetical protein
LRPVIIHATLFLIALLHTMASPDLSGEGSQGACAPAASAPLSVGIAQHGGVLHTLIPRGTPLPASATQLFTSVNEDQELLMFQIFAGERVYTADCVLVGIQPVEVSPGPRATAQVEVRLTLAANGDVRAEFEDAFASGGRKGEEGLHAWEGSLYRAQSVQQAMVLVPEAHPQDDSSGGDKGSSGSFGDEHAVVPFSHTNQPSYPLTQPVRVFRLAGRTLRLKQYVKRAHYYPV